MSAPDPRPLGYTLHQLTKQSITCYAKLSDTQLATVCVTPKHSVESCLFEFGLDWKLLFNIYLFLTRTESGVLR